MQSQEMQSPARGEGTVLVAVERGHALIPLGRKEGLEMCHD